ncbi:MaoC/PaaZ C-terminal domain-containing protein [Brevibacillus nitrificans]|uniref:MaoC family dehydratase n=1 Tax=Brevibacillus nitrificans TaxID=651560 RepID=UPI0028590C99|nr:MaoC/PaaZ C-terminal domain-containing protein [Brevibacillus nitrificans]MDR7314721.1 acyl dehydratase [Brevibacillus nitrificans]
MSNLLPFQVGDTCSFSKTITETEVYQFADITGDYSQMHTDEEFMKTTKYKTRIAHGIISLAIGSTASTLIQVQAKAILPSVSFGYDRLRFIKPVFFGDTLTAKYTIIEVDEENLRTVAKVEVFNQNDEICTYAQHILKFFPV